jgi:alpha-galactosidase
MRTALLQRLDSDGDSINFGFVAPDQSRAIFTYNLVKETGRTMPPRLRFAGLNPQALYRLTLAWPSQLKEYSPSVLQVVPGETFGGDALMRFGMQMPILHPQTSLIFLLEQQG